MKNKDKPIAAIRFCVFAAMAILLAAAPLSASEVEYSTDATTGGAPTSDVPPSVIGTAGAANDTEGTAVAVGESPAPVAVADVSAQPSLNMAAFPAAFQAALQTAPPAIRVAAQNALQAGVSAWAAGSGPACVRRHESGGRYGTNTGNGYYGAYQFDLSTWESNGGGAGLPSSYPPAVQDQIAFNIWSRRGWEPWPNTSRACGIYCASPGCN